tara:strand:+ start:226 stop:441 length:216 start_codon:yes stop_codon:yes gene_type:complete
MTAVRSLETSGQYADLFLSTLAMFAEWALVNGRQMKTKIRELGMEMKKKKEIGLTHLVGGELYEQYKSVPG